MIKKTVYFGNPAYLSLKNNQLVIKIPAVEKSKEFTESFKEESTRRIPIEDIGILILDHKQITLTHALMEKLLEHNCALITCDSKRMPTGLLLPLTGNSIQTERYRYQIEASIPLKKQLWQQTVEAKIGNQAHVLSRTTGITTKKMERWQRTVKSGDSDNHEAQAAVYYWANLFPKIDSFVRNRDGIPPNNLLNYGYAILRATVARALVASGLLPSLGIHHRNKYNAYCLADDIMEPYRPFVDLVVIELMHKTSDISTITQDHKCHLLSIPTLDVIIQEKRSPLMIAVQQTTASLAQCYMGELRRIKYPTFI
ncbi:type II CRISPR-associated endonuclease Cas1 [Porphyromonadaceae bacterium W3.11]|nr:type II CRISPR-associated endonuclease Cas1 [Porphyromonadaceae bacterium W3.11]